MAIVNGFLILGDITGYTSYIAETELAHSQEILAELLELIVKQFQQKLTIVKLEGDAVFAHAPDTDLFACDNILDIVESTYRLFKERVEHIVLNTTCDCDACILIPKLDLKFFVHYGEYFVQDIAGIKELVGSDVNLIHRLTKNHLTEHTGWDAYALFTEKSLEKSNIQKENMYEHKETYEHLGEVMTYNINLLDWYADLEVTRKVFITAEEADIATSSKYSFKPEVVWEWITNIEKRNLVDQNTVWGNLYRPGGRMGVGTKNHCAHGDSVTYETILDWQPYDYYSTFSRDDLELETLSDGYFTFQFIPDGDGTILNVNIKFTMKAPQNEKDAFIKEFTPRAKMLHKMLNNKMLELIKSPEIS